MRKVILGTLIIISSLFLNNTLVLSKNITAENPITISHKIAESNSEIVVFNVHTHKFHNPKCIWAKRCTVNCVEISREEAIKRNGVPCQVCGG